MTVPPFAVTFVRKSMFLKEKARQLILVFASQHHLSLHFGPFSLPGLGVHFRVTAVRHWVCHVLGLRQA